MFNICVGIFYKFKDEKGGFKEDLITNVKGMLGLYEATNLRVHESTYLKKHLLSPPLTSRPW